MQKPVICIGASFVDELFHAGETVLKATTNAASVTKTAGGVSRNIAHQLALLGVPVHLISVFGNDSDGRWLKEQSTEAGVSVDDSITREGLSGKYTGILDADGSLFTAFLTNSALEWITPDYLETKSALLQKAAFILADANISVEAVKWLLDFCKTTSIPFILEPVSVPPAKKFQGIALHGMYLVTPNEDELPVMCEERSALTQHQIEELLNRGVEKIWLHNGKHGSALYSRTQTISLHAPEVEVVDCTGAGDGSLTGYLLGKYLDFPDAACLRLAHTLSAEILKVNGAIAPNLSQEKLLSRVANYYPDFSSLLSS
jgi:pseudouridine kinase